MTNHTLIQMLKTGIALIETDVSAEYQVKTMIVMAGLLRDRAQRIQHDIAQQSVDNLDESSYN